MNQEIPIPGQPERPLAPLSAPEVSSADWQHFTGAALAADRACYPRSADRAEPARLFAVMAAFPAGFQVYFAQLPDGTSLPVGYTGWYPVAEDIFAQLYNTPGEIKHRGFIKPLSTLSDKGDYIYLFNYSIIPSLRGTAQSRQLIKDYAATLKNIAIKGMAAVTVSEDGARIAEKFGLSCRGDMTHDGDVERVYAACL